MTKIIKSLHVRAHVLHAIIISLFCLLATSATAQTTCTSNDPALCASATADAGVALTANGTTIVNTSGTTFTLSGANNTVYSATTTGSYRVTTAGCIAVRFNVTTTGTINTASSVTITTGTGTVMTCAISSISGNVACVRICNPLLTVGTTLSVRLNFDGNLNGGKTVTVSAFSVLNMEALLGPTPVTILNFDYQPKNCGVALRWSTAQETNSKEFVIQNSIDGINWSNVGKVNAQGFSGIQKDYSFVHPNPVNGQNFYRFAAVDLDGSTKYSDVLSPKINCGKVDIKIHPNPFADFVNVYFTSLRVGNATISVRDNAGQTLSNSSYVVQKGSNTIRLDKLAKLPKGVYIISVKTDDGVFNQKLIK